MSDEHNNTDKDLVDRSQSTNSTDSSTTSNTSEGELVWGMEKNTYCMLMHLSQLLNMFFPVIAIALPIIMWATNKDQHKEIDLHGKIVFNWMLSSFIYFCICFVLVFLFVGIPLLIVLTIVSFVFIIIGAIKANDGVYWPYPLSLDIFGYHRSR